MAYPNKKMDYLQVEMGFLNIKSVLVVDGVGANCTEILKAHGIDVTNKAKITKEELLKEIPVSAKC